MKTLMKIVIAVCSSELKFWWIRRWMNSFMNFWSSYWLQRLKKLTHKLRISRGSLRKLQDYLGAIASTSAKEKTRWQIFKIDILFSKKIWLKASTWEKLQEGNFLLKKCFKEYKLLLSKFTSFFIYMKRDI